MVVSKTVYIADDGLQFPSYDEAYAHDRDNLLKAALEKNMPTMCGAYIELIVQNKNEIVKSLKEVREIY